MQTYLDYYNNNYSIKIKAIDLFLKTEMNSNISEEVISDLLDISIDEIHHLVKTFDIHKLDSLSFFIFMQNGSSPVCKLFSRELQRKMPHFYSFYDISYIYQIPYEHVIEGATRANLTNITSENINQLFANIDMQETCMS